MNAQTLNSMTKPELIVMAKNMGIRGLTATKKELVIEAILRKQNAPTIIINPIAPATPASTLRSETRELTPAAQPRRDFPVPTSTEPLSFDKMKLRHLLCFLKPTSYTAELRLLQILFITSPSSFTLNGGHITPGRDEELHYTLSVHGQNLNGYEIINHYHIHYERTEAGREIFTTITNPHREIIADYRRVSSANSVVSAE